MSLTLLLITSFRVDCTMFLDYTGHRRIFWKHLGHKQTSRPCLSWMHLPRIAQNLTQFLVKSYVVPYNKQTKVRSHCCVLDKLAFISYCKPALPWTSSPLHLIQATPALWLWLKYLLKLFCLSWNALPHYGCQRATPPLELDSKGTSTFEENNSSSWNS